VYLETQACGRVLLASDIPAAVDVVTDGETGLLFRKGDIAHLAARTWKGLPIRACGRQSARGRARSPRLTRSTKS
jgi:glycosyltransferase involved in cell wall biosynthesis